jgi:hypothetical protein
MPKNPNPHCTSQWQDIWFETKALRCQKLIIRKSFVGKGHLSQPKKDYIRTPFFTIHMIFLVGTY